MPANHEHSLPPPPAPPDERLLRVVHRVSSAGRSLRRMLADHAAAVAATDAELLIVWLCGERGMVQGDLALAIGVSPALMSGTVERLRSRGLIEMQRSTVDRRRQVWRTTDQGNRMLDDIRPILARLAGQLDRHLSPADQQSVQDLCQRLADAACDDAELPNPPGNALPESTGAAAKGRAAA